MKTFAEFRTSTLKAIQPDGYSPRLRDQLSGWLKDFLIEAQIVIEELQVGHIETIPFTSTFWQCGCTGFQIPDRAIIISVCTRPAGTDCDIVRANFITKGRFAALQEGWSSCGCPTQPTPSAGYDYGAAIEDKSGIQGNVTYSSPETDRPVREVNRWFTIRDNWIWNTPTINSNEEFVLEYAGVRRQWSETTALPWEDAVGEVPREIASMAELFIRFKTKRFIDCQYDESLPMERDYRLALADEKATRRSEAWARPAVRFFTEC